ncbi:peptidylprolyl isomerase [Rhodoligotrophos defluvii]|uniref:peptidylprolyl isomerase n=1 Tax=Rhodoligotrophos defluvii TaxID=2561934 RepID=UPI001485C019|nr:peptidylprolyl isomerase [Rhodoligotrophos defluvii]
MTLRYGLCTAAAVAIAAAIAPLAQAPVAQAQQAAPDDPVVAKVNGYEIKASEVKLAADDLPQLAEVPPQLRYAFVVEYLVERHLMAQEAVKEAIAETNEYKKRLAFYQAKALRDAYFHEKIQPTVNEEDVRKLYDQEAAKVNSVERVHARHILVDTEEQARDALAKIEAGANFADLAKQISKDGSAQYGGDLGFFSADEMVPEFSKAAFALQPGQVSQPVQTNYGWHIIKVEERKVGGAEPFDKVKNGLRMIVLRQKVQEKVAELRKSADVEMVDPDLQRLQSQMEQMRNGQMPTVSGEGGTKPAAQGQ